VIDPSVEPVAFNVRPDGRVAVEVDQVVRRSAGAVLAHGRVVHVHTFRHGLIARMDVEEPARDEHGSLQAPWLLEGAASVTGCRRERAFAITRTQRSRVQSASPSELEAYIGSA